MSNKYVCILPKMSKFKKFLTNRNTDAKYIKTRQMTTSLQKHWHSIKNYTLKLPYKVPCLLSICQTHLH